MADPICTKASLVSRSAYFADIVLNPTQRLAMEVYLMSLQLDAAGGTDYTTDFRVLNEAATDLFRDVGESQRDAFFMAMLSSNATNAGATVPANPTLVESGVQCLQCYTPEQLERMKLALFCQLGTSKAYPQ